VGVVASFVPVHAQTWTVGDFVQGCPWRVSGSLVSQEFDLAWIELLQLSDAAPTTIDRVAQLRARTCLHRSSELTPVRIGYWYGIYIVFNTP